MSVLSSSLPARGEGRLVPLALAVVYVVWGSTYLVLHYALESFPPFLLSGVRFTFAGLVLFAVLRLYGSRAPSFLEWRNAAVTGALLLVIGNGGITLASQWVESGFAAMFAATSPLFAALLGARFGAAPTRRDWIAIALGFTGMAVLFATGAVATGVVPVFVLLLAAVGWALGSLVGKKLPQAPGAMASSLQMTAGGVAMLLIGLVRGEHLPLHPTRSSVLALVYLSLVGSLFAFSAFRYLIVHARPVVATSNNYVNPLVAVALGTLIAGETLQASAWLSALLIVGSVFVLVFPGKKPVPRSDLFAQSSRLPSPLPVTACPNEPRETLRKAG
jgi:drug/metabolite transporter (DMT)-like permease